MKTIEEIVSVLTDEQKQLLKDTIVYGFWGDCDYVFIGLYGKPETDYAYGYITNDAKEAGHFSGRKVSAMFRSMYRRLGLVDGIGEVISHATDWWGDGSGDMLFIRDEYVSPFEKWSKE